MSSKSTTTQAPINQVVPAISQSASFVLSSTLVLIRGLYVTASRFASLVLVLSPVPAFIYIIAPIVVFCQVVFGLFIISPYAFALYLLEVLYPLYVFVGVACITGVLVGLSGSILAGFLTAFVLQITEEKSNAVEENPSTSRVIAT